MISIFLETPIKGEPRKLIINGETVGKNSELVTKTVELLDIWWEKIPKEKKKKINAVLTRKGPFYNPTKEINEAIDLSYVVQTKNYVNEKYIA